VHTNAIIDMTLSKDDRLLATASGDQTARVVDMMTQSTISILGNASASLKQVRFQPGVNNNNVLATSSRDGNIQIWDLRCNGYKGPLHQMQAPVGLRITRSQNLLYGKPVKRILKAHNPLTNQATVAISPIDAPRSTNREVAGRAGDVSVTALQFLPEGQEHILLSGSEADSSIKVWDIRLLHSKQKAQVPLSSTMQPRSHTKWRHFGISSLNLSGDGSRLYSLCKDNTVYAYSTAHLILGHAPELSSSERYPQRDEQKGLGPLYGFRHPEMLTSSFYVKSALRPAKDGECEMLAVGSNNGCAVLFPTDEKYFPKQHREEPHSWKSFNERPRVVAGRVNNNIPILTHGTPLIRGHNDREVGSLCWTSEGDLVTVGDDFLVRLWREDGDDARELRTAGEFGGSRWGCGWADVGTDYDKDEDFSEGDTLVNNIVEDEDLDESMSE
jgi:WD40 repeat protein